MNEPFELSPDECRELLSAGLVGRVAVCTPVGPHIVPVNYAVVDDDVVLRTSPYSVLGSHARGSILALEVDHFDYERQRGWSVVARGRAEAVTSAEELNHIRRVWDPNAWASGTAEPLSPDPMVGADRSSAGPGAGTRWTSWPYDEPSDQRGGESNAGSRGDDEPSRHRRPRDIGQAGRCACSRNTRSPRCRSSTTPEISWAW